MKSVKKYLLPIICIAIAVFFTWLCLEDLFSDIALEQMLWHIKNVELLAEGYTSDLIIFRYVLTIVFYCGLFTALFLYDGAIASFLASRLKKFLPRAARHLVILRFLYAMEIGAGLTAIAYLGHFMPEVWQIAKMQLFPDTVIDNPFIERHMDLSAASNLSFPEGKNNLVCILVESMEDSFEGYIPNLEQLRKRGISSKHMHMVYGTSWTIAAQTAWHFGLPLKTPLGINRNKYIARDGFLPNATSIFDILSQYGYKCVLVMGTDAVFGGAELLFSKHGNFGILDKKYFMSKGHELAKNQGTEWGYSDSFVLDMAFQIYRELVEGEQPFVLFISTMDTHSPTGYAPPEARDFGDIRDAILEADRNVAAFAQKILDMPKKHDRLAICVLGDHEYMGMPDFLKTIKERRLYNFFGGRLPQLPHGRLDMSFSALDIAPTLLHMAGARWQSGRFGLGASLFSDAPSLHSSPGTKAGGR